MESFSRESNIMNWFMLGRWLPYLLLGSLGAALIAYGITQRLGPIYEAHFSYLISLTEREAAPDFRFDGYYAISATDLFAETVAQWASTPEVIVQAHQAAGVALPNPSPRQLRKIVQARQAAPQLVRVTIRAPQEETVQKLAVGLQQVMEHNVTRYQEQGIPAVRFRLVASEPWVGVERPATNLIVIATFILTLLLGFNAVIFFSGWPRS